MTRIRSFAQASQHTTAGPYSPLLEVTPGSLIVLSGQGPLDDDGRLVGDDIRAQTAATFANCARQLAVAGADFTHVFKVNVYLADLSEWDQFNEAYLEVFAEPMPVRTTVGVNLLLGMKIEVDIWAAR